MKWCVVILALDSMTEFESYLLRVRKGKEDTGEGDRGMRGEGRKLTEKGGVEKMMGHATRKVTKLYML